MRVPAAAASARYAAVGVVLLVGLWLTWWSPLTVALYLAYGVVGAVLVARRPRNPAGWLVFLLAFAFVGNGGPRDLDIAALRAGTAGLRDATWAWLNGWSGNAAFFLYLVLTLLFPDGRLPRGGGRRTALVLLVLGAAVVAVSAFGPGVSVVAADGISADVPNPWAVAPGNPVWAILTLLAGGTIPLVLMVLVGAGMMLGRLRRASGVVRQQLRWLVTSLAFVGVAVIVGLGLSGLTGSQTAVPWIPAMAAFLSVPLAIAVAILRFRLFDLDLILRRTLVYGVLSAALAAVYVSTVVALQWLAMGLRGASSDLVVVVSTLFAAGLVLPLRRRVQAVIDRRFYRSRFDTERALRAVFAALRGEVVPERVAGAVLGVIDHALHPDQVSLWLNPDADSHG